MNESEKHSFVEFLEARKSQESIEYFAISSIQKAYYVGAYARAVINSSYNSEVSKGNTTYKSWLSNQIINYRNLDRIFDMAFRFEQKLKLKIRNDSEVRRLAHEVPATSSAGFSNARISYAFVAGFDDYSKFTEKYPTTKEVTNNKIQGE
ncbi:MAG: hypothetical protein RBS89_05835 [Candidatus Delongbacteria bacterium]|jgi:hypothetical protein|nr:hypothetical protein [Candidatus Delongbacteria bacterium]